MPTDPARVHRNDPGDPEKCPVWRFRQLYSNSETQAWVVHGCTTAAIGCLVCKQPVIEAIVKEQAPWRERATPLPRQPEAGARDRRDRHRAGPDGGARNDARSARRDGSQLLARQSAAPDAELKPTGLAECGVPGVSPVTTRAHPEYSLLFC